MEMIEEVSCEKRLIEVSCEKRWAQWKVKMTKLHTLTVKGEVRLILGQR